MQADPRRPEAQRRGSAGRGLRLLLPALTGLLLSGGCQTTPEPLEVVSEIDLDRYTGTWFEIASFPQRFQKNCVATTATYTRRDDGRIRVVNACRDRTLEGPVRSIEGVAWVSDPMGSPARLKVQFFWPFSGDYWVIDLDPEYRHAVVGHPSRNYLWILSREPVMDGALYAELVERVAALGFDPDRLVQTPQVSGQRVPMSMPPP